MADLAFLGPEGTFTHRAALDLARDGETLVPLDHAEDVIAAIVSGRADGAIIAFENSLDGPVAANLDLLLATEEDIVITAERVIPVAFDLWRLPGDDAPLTGVVSHPVGLGQCKRFIAEHRLATRAASSNAVACREVAAAAEPGWAALAGPDAGAQFGLVATEHGIRDDERAATRFVRLGRRCPGPSGRDRSAFVLHPEQDRAGSLVTLLQEFSSRGVNMTAIKSRPTKELLGEYVFFVETQGHLQDPRVRDAALGLLRGSVDVRYLGSYPEDPTRPTPGAGRDEHGDEHRRLRAMLDRTEGA
ncbi:prephenate dehydratase [Patulibacter sp. SYSU D01012]|uniref:prephenate dehydratase n=1 Tax=Patulibacter sp. SYSU D01012 TaxID=2817381 RepID=UPI001B30B2A4|nr:prephenate dehydratase [Patulibacter sp. SYSU D01012]